MHLDDIYINMQLTDIYVALWTIYNNKYLVIFRVTNVTIHYTSRNESQLNVIPDNAVRRLIVVLVSSFYWPM